MPPSSPPVACRRESERERHARDVQIAAAVREATRAPLVTARIADEVLALTELLAPIGNRNAVSDVGVAALLAVTAVRGAALNVEINLPYLGPTSRCGATPPRRSACCSSGWTIASELSGAAVAERLA